MSTPEVVYASEAERKEAERLEKFLTSIPAMSTENKVKLYIQARNAKSVAKKAFEVQTAGLDQIMEHCENIMLRDALAAGVTGFQTTYGTTYMAETKRISIADSTAFTAFLDALPADGDRYGFFAQRVASERIEDYIKIHGEAPPGLNIFRENVMRVRKASEK